MRSRSDRPRLALPALRPVYEAYVRAADELPGQPDALHAELWTSVQLGELERAAPHAAGHRAAVADLVRTLRAAATPGARTLLLAIAAIVPDEPGAEPTGAGEAAAGLRDLPAPPWAGDLGRVTPGPDWLIEEGPLDADRLVCEFRHAGGALHALAVRLEPGDRIAEIVVVGDVSGLWAEVRRAVRAELCVVSALPAAEAAGRLRATLAGPCPADCYSLLAFARHRVAALPAPAG